MADPVVVENTVKSVSIFLQYAPEIIAGIGALWAALKVQEKISAYFDKKESAILKQLESIAFRAVAEVAKDYADAIKKARADGVLTKEESKEAMRLALERLKEIAKDEGLDLAKAAAIEYLPGLIEKVLLKFKKD